MDQNALTIGKLIPFIKKDLNGLGANIFSLVQVPEFQVFENEDTLGLSMILSLEKSLRLQLPGFPAIELIVDMGSRGYDAELQVDFYPTLFFELYGIDIGIRFSTSLFKPVEQKSDGSFKALLSKSGKPRSLEIALKDVLLDISSSGEIGFSLFDESVPLSFNAPFMIADSGVVIDVDEFKLLFSKTGSFSGIDIPKATVYLQGFDLGIKDLTIKNFKIESSGFSGEIGLEAPKTIKVFGMKLELTKLALSFAQNALIGSEIKGKITIPFFKEKIDVAVGFDLNGNMSLTMEKAGGHQIKCYSDGSKVFTLTIDSLGFEKRGDKYEIHISGDLKPEVANLDWPTLEIKDLAIDADGNLSIDGGWLDLPTQKSLDFHGFQLEITKLGFGGEDDGTKWIGFSASVNLVEGLPAGASVEGLRILWKAGSKPSVSFNGIGIKFEIPNALKFSGAVSYVEEKKPVEKHYFTGAIKLELVSLGLTIDGALLIGENKEQPPFTYFYIFLDTQIPVGVPLFSSGLSLYGIAGLFADNMAPDKTDKQHWYDDWYKGKPIGVTSTDKWDDKRDALAVGAGVTVGTSVDSGYSFSSRALLVISLPGPVIILAGRAQVLAKRTELVSKDEPPFKALVVIDGRAGTFLFNVDATYRLPESNGMLLDAHAGAEGYFARSDDWHFYLGEKDPRDKRMRASIIQLFEANAYLMLDPDKIQMGAFLAYKRGFDFDVVSAKLEAWIEGGTLISWQPNQFDGYLWLHGAMGLRVFGFGFGLSADAKIEVETPTPYLVLIGLSVEIDLPWFLPDIDVDVELKWQEEIACPLPIPLKDIAVGHFKVSDTWAVAKLPNYDKDANGFKDTDATLTKDPKQGVVKGEKMPPFKKNWPDVPVIPMDARPVLTFGRKMDDLLGFGTTKPPQSETVGKNDYRYELVEIVLEKWSKTANKWDSVAFKKAIPSKKPKGTLGGQWQATGDKGAVATKLYLWSKSGFDYLRVAGRTWADYFIEQNLGFPCLPEKKPMETCIDFDGLPVGTMLGAVFNQKEATFIAGENVQVVPYSSTLLKTQHAIRINNLSSSNPLRIVFKNSVTKVTTYVENGSVMISAYRKGVLVGSPESGIGAVTVKAQAIDYIELTTLRTGLLLERICYVTLQEEADALAWRERNKGFKGQMEQWSQSDYVFEPDTDYRLEVATRVRWAPKGTAPADQDKWKAYTFEQYGYFRTEGPPGLINLPPRKQKQKPGKTQPEQSPPAKVPDQEYKHPLTDLAPYVEPRGRTIPGEDQRQKKGEPPRPVYRGYDIGLEFNENYVDLMYRLAGRDLGVYIYDNNGQPLRDANGRLLIVTNYWGDQTQLSLEFEDNLWIDTVNRSSCAVIDTKTIKLSDSIGLGNDGMVLRSATLHEVRVIPLLLRDDFRAGEKAWGNVYPEGEKGGHAQWDVRSETVKGKKHYFLIQTSDHHGETPGVSEDKPGTYRVRGDKNWRDYRLSVVLRTVDDDDAIGVMFRYTDKDNYYRFSMDKQRAYRRLIRKVGGVVQVLAQDTVPYEINRDYEVTVEAIADDIRIFLDGALLFKVKDDKLKKGQVGVYCWANKGARFSDVRVDDFNSKTTPVYRFDLVTSRYVDFAHYMHSFQDTVWDLPLKSALDNSQIQAATGKAVAVDTFYKLLGLSRRGTPSAVELSLLRLAAQRVGLLLESPEPIQWDRVTTPKIEYAGRSLPATVSPKTVKLIGATFAKNKITSDANEEHVDVMLRDALNPSGYVIQHVRHPGSVEPVTKEIILFNEDDFSKDSFQKRWTVEDEGTFAGPSNWKPVNGVLRQTSNILGEGKTKYDKPGTYAVTGDDTWTDYRLIVRLRSDDNDAIGVMFRYRDKDNYYRFSMDSEHQYRWLIKKVNGTTTELWSDGEAFETGRSYTITVDAFGNELRVYLDGKSLLKQNDSDLKAGKIGLYCWGNVGGNFFNVSVKALPWKTNLLFSEDFRTDLSNWVDEKGVAGGGTNWKTTEGVLRQTSSIHGDGTFLVAGNKDWADYQFSVRVQSDESGAIGVLFRYVDKDNHYRFSMDNYLAYRRLVRKANGMEEVLWEDSAAYKKDRQYIVVINASGARLRGSLDGVPVFDVLDESDKALENGKIGLYCWGNKGACFADARVTKSAPAELVLFSDRFHDDMSQWTVVDEGTPTQPAAWKVVNGALTHTAETHGGSLDPTEADKPGTFVISGNASWDDYTYTVRLRSDSEYAIGVMARYKDPSNYYRFSMDRRLGYQRLIKKVNGKVTPLCEDKTLFQTGQYYQVIVEVKGTQIRVLIDGVEVCKANDSELNTGKVGLYCWGNAKAYFDDVKVTTQKWVDAVLVDDQFTEFNKRRWSVESMVSSHIGTGWQVTRGVLAHVTEHPGTAVVTGTRHWVDYRFSVMLRSEGNGTLGVTLGYQHSENAFYFVMDRRRSRLVRHAGGGTQVLWQSRKTFQPGTWHTLTVDVGTADIEFSLDEERPIKVSGISGEGQIGLCAWEDDSAQFDNVRVTQKTLKTVILLADDFSGGMNAWQVVDEGMPSPAASWEVKQGALVQTAETHGGSLDPKKPEKPGTYVVAGNAKWTDYRFAVRLHSETEYGIGVMFRYKDANNYYRFSMDYRLGYCRLIKKVKGVVSVLDKELLAAWEPKQDYLITVDAFADRLQVYVDGILVFDVIDSALPKGYIGLYSWGNSGARFKDVEVVAPQFVDYYRFERESFFPAGSVVRIHAGDAISHTKPEKGIQQRYLAQLGEKSWPLLKTQQEVLRVVSPDGSKEHCRPFLPPSAYGKAKDVSIIRTTDGCAAFLMVPANGKVSDNISDGEYRLSLNFKRDTKDPKRPVLRRAGSSDPENVTVDFEIKSKDK